MTHIPGLLIEHWYALIAAYLLAFALFSSLCHRLVRRWL